MFTTEYSRYSREEEDEEEEEEEKEEDNVQYDVTTVLCINTVIIVYPSIIIYIMYHSVHF